MPTDETLSLRDALRDRFDSAGVGVLLAGRNPNLGNILLAERGIFYLQILYRIFLFRREHELEPLYEDIFETVREAQRKAAEGGGYSPDMFRQDITQLTEWDLLDERMEMERLRGYRDSRRKKFRYSLTGESQAFLEWLEDRAQADLEAGDEDTRDVLEEVCGILSELNRNLANFGTVRAREDDSRRIFYQLSRLDDLTIQANRNITAFNARLLGFVIRGYDLGEAKGILRDMDDFVNRFLRRVYELRHDIVEAIDKLLLSRNQDKLRQCAEFMEAERLKTPHLLRRGGNCRSQIRIPFSLAHFYEDGGMLDQICHRISESAIKVWRKLHAHLRELERKNNRIEDLRARIADIAALPEETVPGDFLRELISSAAMTSDPNYWDDHVQADPPQPRLDQSKTVSRHIQPIRKKSLGGKPAVSLDEQRLRDLAAWTERRLGGVDIGGRPLSSGTYTTFNDAANIIGLAKAGILGKGRRLNRVDLALQPLPDTPVTIKLTGENVPTGNMDVLPDTDRPENPKTWDEARLKFNDMLVKKKK